MHNYLCVCLHFFGLFDFLCAIPCLPYILEWFCSLIRSFLLPKCSLLYFFFFVGFSRCHSLVFLSFWLRSLLIFVLHGIFACYAVLRCSVCVVSSFFVDFLTHFMRLFFLHILFGLNEFKFAVFGGFWRCYLYFAFCLFEINTQN